MDANKLEIGLPVIISSEYKDNPKLVGFKARVIWKPDLCIGSSLILLGLDCDAHFAKLHKLHDGFGTVSDKDLGFYKGYCIWANLHEFNTLD